MTTLEVQRLASSIKLSSGSSQRSCSISIARRPILMLQFDKPQKGGQGLGKKHRVVELHIDSDYRVFAKYIVKDVSVANSEQYALIGKIVLGEVVS